MREDLIISNVISALKSVLKHDENKPIALSQPWLNGNEWKYVKSCIDEGWVSSSGEYVDRFEANLAEFTGVKHAVAVVNGTAALHISLLLSGVKQGDEVLIPALTFVAGANAICYLKAVPHFIDSDDKSLGVDANKLCSYLKDTAYMKGNVCYNKKTQRPIRAVIAVHTFGHPADLDALLEVCRKFNLELIEDCAQGLGSYYKNIHVGNFGKVSAFSFNGNKIITTGGGGAVVTNSLEVAKIAKHITKTAKIPHPWFFIHDSIGYNYRMPNINAALGCAQLENIEKFLKNKRALAKKYQEAFENLEGVSFFKEPEYAKSNYWLNTIILNEEYSFIRDLLLVKTNSQKIGTRPPWMLLNKLPMFRDCPSMDLKTSEYLEKSIINIPSSTFLGEGYVKE